MCVLLCEHGIACSLRWGVALVILIGHCSPRCGTPFLGAGYVHAADPHPGPQVLRKPNCGFEKPFYKKNYILHVI